MSYILDAVRKSDQERRRGAAPTLQSAQSFAVSGEPRRRWMYPALAIALATAAFAIGWIRPWQKEPAAAPAPGVAPVPDSATAAVPPAPAVVAPPPAPPLATQSAQEPPARASSAPSSAAKALAETPSNEGTRARATQAAAPEAGAAPSAQAVEPQKRLPRETPPKNEKAREDTVPTVGELPASLQGELPAMAITVHAYSTAPKDRLLGVNGKLLREGEALTPDLVLEQITPDGMIFSYKGTRFRRGLR